MQDLLHFTSVTGVWSRERCDSPSTARRSEIVVQLGQENFRSTRPGSMTTGWVFVVSADGTLFCISVNILNVWRFLRYLTPYLGVNQKPAIDVSQ